MSDPALTAVHQQIAETLDAEGLGDSAWDFFAVCPQGHRHAVSAMATYCRVCVNQWIDGGGSSLGNSRERVWQAHRDNPEWRPDWIIREAGRDPRNFSDTVILLAVIDEWCAFRGARWSMGRTAVGKVKRSSAACFPTIMCGSSVSNRTPIRFRSCLSCGNKRWASRVMPMRCHDGAAHSEHKAPPRPGVWGGFLIIGGDENEDEYDSLNYDARHSSHSGSGGRETVSAGDL